MSLGFSEPHLRRDGCLDSVEARYDGSDLRIDCYRHRLPSGP
jgi:hypothetical protein